MPNRNVKLARDVKPERVISLSLRSLLFSDMVLQHCWDSSSALQTVNATVSESVVQRPAFALKDSRDSGKV